jgi:CheY-like chemotaxis protein
MSHEIRTPLNAILGYSQLMMRDSALGPGTKENLNIINRCGVHLLALLNDILDMAKIESGQVAINPAPFNLVDLVDDLKAMFRLRAETKGLRLEVFINPNCRRFVEADLGKLRQVLVNLLGNAVKFTERGSIHLRLSMERREQEQLWLSVHVEDTGLGIAAGEQANFFRPFAQSQSGRNLQGGTGLGLAISQQFIRLMGGEIKLLSQPGKGSTFYFEVLVRPAAEELVSNRAGKRRVIGIESPQPAPRVLIVDDEPSIRGWLVSLLSVIGFDTREADDGMVAIQIWKEWKPDLILMDIRMPGTDGIQATRRIRQHPGGMESIIIALSASAMHDDRARVMNSGVDDFLSKPCEEDELLGKIQSHLNTRLNPNFNLTYLYDHAEPSRGDSQASGAPGHASVSVHALPAAVLPPDLCADLLLAIRNGQKNRLDAFIEQAGKWDLSTSHALKDLADRYEYDTLTRLLEGAAL